MNDKRIPIKLPEIKICPTLDIPLEDFNDDGKFSLDGKIGTYKPNNNETYLLFALRVNGKDEICYVKLPNGPNYC